MRTSKERRICIICEGFEEVEYLDALINKAVFSDKYEFVLINSKSINNISTIYQIRYQSNSYDLVLVFCDTDKLQYIESYEVAYKFNLGNDFDVETELSKTLEVIEDTINKKENKNKMRKLPYLKYQTYLRFRAFLHGHIKITYA